MLYGEIGGRKRHTGMGIHVRASQLFAPRPSRRKPRKPQIRIGTIPGDDLRELLVSQRCERRRRLKAKGKR